MDYKSKHECKLRSNSNKSTKRSTIIDTHATTFSGVSHALTESLKERRKQEIDYSIQESIDTHCEVETCAHLFLVVEFKLLQSRFSRALVALA